MNKDHKDDNFFRLERVDDIIELCYVDIAALTQQLLRECNFDNLKTRSILFTHKHLQQPLLSNKEFERLNSFKVLKKQVEWLSGRFSIKHLVKQYKLSELGYDDIVLDYMEEGAPFISGHPDLAISISHSYNYAVGGLALRDDVVFGVDIEKIVQITKESLPQFFNIAFTKKEREYLRGQSFDIIYKNWTLKEAFLKYIKRGFHEPIHNIEIFDDVLFYKGARIDDLSSVTMYLYGDYVLSVLYKVRR